MNEFLILLVGDREPHGLKKGAKNEMVADSLGGTYWLCKKSDDARRYG